MRYNVLARRGTGKDIMRKDNFSYLLIALLIFIIAVPALHELGLLSTPVSRALGLSSLLAIGVWSLRRSGRVFVIGMAVVVAGIVLNLIAVSRDSEPLQIASMLALFVFLTLAMSSAMRQVAAGNDMSPNRIVGAICIYLLLGVMWAIAYAVLEYSQPGSFRGLTEATSAVWNADWVYFSFITITTLGYGDITPLTQTARSLAFSEAIVGQFYIAVLVAGLVSAYISAKQRSSGED